MTDPIPITHKTKEFPLPGTMVDMTDWTYARYYCQPPTALLDLVTDWAYGKECRGKLGIVVFMSFYTSAPYRYLHILSPDHGHLVTRMLVAYDIF